MIIRSASASHFLLDECRKLIPVLVKIYDAIDSMMKVSIIGTMPTKLSCTLSYSLASSSAIYLFNCVFFFLNLKNLASIVYPCGHSCQKQILAYLAFIP